jgi:hypothetical protein
MTGDPNPATPRITSPIGLDLGACRWGGAGRPLAETTGRIHHDV